MSYVFKDAVIVTMNPDREIMRCDLLVEGDTIKAMENINVHRLDLSATRVVEANGQIIVPGLIQAHVHLCQTVFRGQADDLDLLDWLKERIWPLEGAHDPESVYYSALLGIGELFRSGTTAIIDMGTVNYTEATFQAIIDSGIRAVSGKCMMDWGDDIPGNLMENTAESLQKSVDLLEKWHGRGHGRLTYAFAPRFAVSCSEDLLIKVRDLSKKYNVKIHTHAAENMTEVSLVQQERKMRNIVYFDHLGIAGENLILAHCVWLNNEEIAILRRQGVKVVHCPASNLKLGSGIARITEMLSGGICVSLGSDGAPCNNNLDIFQEMRLAALMQKPFHGPTAISAKQVFELATLGGAKTMGLDKQIGSLEVGKKADLAMINLNNIHCSPGEDVDIYSQLVYQAKSSDVTLTMVNGRIVYEKGHLNTIDEDETIRQAQIAARRVRRRAGFL